MVGYSSDSVPRSFVGAPSRQHSFSSSSSDYNMSRRRPQGDTIHGHDHPRGSPSTYPNSPERGPNGSQNISRNSAPSSVDSIEPRSAPTRASDIYRFGSRSAGQNSRYRAQNMISSGFSSNFAQEFKVKLSKMPRSMKHSTIYQALEQFGNIIRIEIVLSMADSTAYVVFQPPPTVAFWNSTIPVGQASARVDTVFSKLFYIPSPINPSRQYEQDNLISANMIEFGVRTSETTLMVMQTVRAQGDVTLLLNLKKKFLQVKFPIAVDGKQSFYRFEMPFALLEKIHRVEGSKKEHCALIIPFETPPQLYKKTEDVAKTCEISERVWHDWCAWFRQTEVIDSRSKALIASNPVMELRGKAIIDIGEWSCYRITFDASKLGGRQYQEFSDALTDHGVSIISHVAFDTEQRREDPLLELLQDELSSTHPHLAPQKGATAELFTTAISLPFPVRYALEVCLSNHFLVRHNITRTFLERLASMDVEQSIYVLEKVAEKQKVYYNPMEIFEIRVKGETSKRIPRYCVLSRGANVTPTMVHAAPSVVETSNRVIRKFITDSDRFLRVKFSDEKTEGRLTCQDGGRTDDAFDRVKRAMTHGIVLCGRYYEFLAYGNSQFRENGAYFYAPTPTVSTEEIRHLLGSFDHIRTVAKWGARQGQCFSSTRAMSINVIIRQIPDIERNGFCFTDGVGKLSLFLAQMAAQELGLQNPFDDPPSLFQFRLAGCKGVLALDPKVMGTEVHIRPSQYKFEGESQGLEIIRASALASANFNRQLIAVLSNLGVNDYVFITKQQEMVNYLEKATTNESVALERLQRNIDFNQTSLTMAGMVLDGFMKSREPFMMSLLQLWRAYNMKWLKERARIVIDDGAFVLGCVDEFGVLKGHYNDQQCSSHATREQKLATLPEVFIKISDPAKKGFYKVITGLCVMARNPSLHPGDLRVVRAVDVPELQHLKNVLVLPQTGDRDLANMCSGGDLDGDDYLVLWDQDLIPKFINETPMDFSAPKPEELNRPVTVNDIADFFVTYMKNDSLARIALAHLAQSDAKDEGVRSEECLELAALHSQAVDYPKSGIAAIMKRSLKPGKWPHFMENKHRTKEQQYKSIGILGKLFDQVKLVDFKPAYENAFDNRILDAFEFTEGMIEKAMDLKELHDSAVRRLMAKHGIRTEFEVWSVFALSHNQEMRDYSFAEEFGKTVDATKNQFRALCREAAGATDSSDFVRMAPFVAAMYTATANEVKQALSECRTMQVVGGQQVPVRRMIADEMPLMSFPWLFVNDLGKIATGNRSDRVNAAVRQGLAKKTKKHVDSKLEPVKPDIETQQGITHYGELLELDFGSPTIVEAAGVQSDGESTKASHSGGSDSADQNDDGDDDGDSEVEEVSIVTKKMSALDRLKALD